ncbi:uncharacterized protein LOC122859366 [Aphidius gifuensis]|uniref:uncharacterized protein LOC122859366 n=1 Tax=Aphidius gifuensis TaxID=684658 RepID=UPI001CDCB71A|nr:uncharacterized protein LOC122859366 [Aphidius gifuensis]
MKLVIILLTSLCCRHGLSEFLDNDDILHSPPIVYPYGGTLKLLVGIASPISMGGRILVYGQNFQVQYALPTNATFFTNYYSSLKKRRKRSSSYSHERTLFYQFLEQELQRWGANGKSCMMKSICEACSTPLRDEGLVGEILNVILTPDYGNSSSYVDENYLQAAETGRRGNDCSVIYSECPEGYGLLEKISRIQSINFD